MHQLSTAKWIFCDSDTERTNRYADFFVPVAVKRGVRYLLTLSADADLAVFLDNATVPIFFHTFPDTPARKTYEGGELTDTLSVGEHCLKITVYCPNKNFSTYRRNRPALRFALSEDGRPIAVSSKSTQCRENPNYKSDGVPTVSAQLGFSFDFDGCQAETKTHDAVELTDMPEKVYPREVPRFSTDTVAPLTVVSSGRWCDGDVAPEALDFPAQRMQKARLDEDESPIGTYTIYDVGREEVAYFAMVTEAPAQTEILVGYGEHLDNGRCRTAIGRRNFAFRVRVPAGRYEFFAPFLRLGLRYLQIFSTRDDVKVEPRLCPAVYPVTEAPYYAPKGSKHETIERIARRTLHLCMHDHYEDCPWREQALYAMDGRSEMLSAFYAFGETAMTKSSLRLFADTLRPDALIELCAPARVSITIPAFSAAFVIALREYFDNSGDRDTVLELLPAAYEILSGFYGRMKHNDWMLPAYRQKGYWNFYEWSDGLAGSLGKEQAPEDMSYDAPLMALVAMAFTAYGELLMKLGTLDKNAKMYDEGDAALHCSEELCERLNDHFWDDDVGLYRTRLGVSLSDGSPYKKGEPHYAELTQVLCVLCGAVPDDRLDALLERIYKKDGLVPATLSSGLFRYEALLRRPERYARPVLDEIEARFCAMLEKGATAFWEVEEGADAFHGAGSLCHGWSAFPIILYAKYREIFFGNTTESQ